MRMSDLFGECKYPASELIIAMRFSEGKKF